MDDDLGLQSGNFYSEKPESQSKSEIAERAKLSAAKPFLNDILDHLQMRIDFYDSLDSIQVDIEKDPATFQKIHAANKLTRDSLKNEKELIETLIEAFQV